MKALAYYDGKIGAPEELTVPFNDRVHFFGDGCYDATVGANGKVYLLQDHLDRFYTSAKLLDIHIPMEKQELGALLTRLLGMVDSKINFVYWQVTRGVEERNHVYSKDLPGKLWVYIRPQHLNDPDVPIKLNDEEDTRFYHCNIKTLNLLPSVMTAQRAKCAGFGETVFHRGDIVTECAHSNVSVLKDGVFYSHPNDAFILRGIAKTHMIQACYRLGIPVLEEPFTFEFLKNADEIIVTSSSNFCLHACELNGEKVGGKDPATLTAIQNEVLREFYDYTGCTSLWE
ncbi:MAG: aminotransferase class IV [Firmicutes bacterium]|nr:aminotransferase class IV [Bacillota bacterium]